MKTLAAIFGAFGVLPGWVWAALLAGFALQSCGQGRTIEALRLDVATAQIGEAKAKTALSNRIAAEALTVAAAIAAARTEKQTKQDLQEVKINELHAQNTLAAAELAGARQRMRNAIYGIAPGAGGADLPKGAGLALRTQDSAGTELQAAGGILANGLLQLTADADEVTRERNTCVALHP